MSKGEWKGRYGKGENPHETSFNFFLSSSSRNLSRSSSLRNESTDSSVELALAAALACRSFPLVSFLLGCSEDDASSVATCNFAAMLRSPLFPLVSVAMFGTVNRFLKEMCFLLRRNLLHNGPASFSETSNDLC